MRTVFHLVYDDVEVNAPAPLVRALIRLCDGNTALQEVKTALDRDWPNHSIESFLGQLQKIGVLIDSASMSSHQWQYVEYPARFPRDVSPRDLSKLVRESARRHRQSRATAGTVSIKRSPVERLLQRRQSHRDFTGDVAPLADIGRMLWAGYGVTSRPLSDKPKLERHTVPSAGALYPLQISLVLMRAADTIESGVYDIVFNRRSRVGFRLVNRDWKSVVSAFPDPEILARAHGIAVLSGSFEIVEKKYGNRALLLVPLEAGHAAQNMHLCAQECGLGTVEIGWYFDRALADGLKLGNGFAPMTSVVFGVVR